MTKRIEHGFFLDKKDADEFIDRLAELSPEEKFEDDYNHTIYMNNLEYEVPLSLSIRARRYADKGLSDGAMLETESKWFLERKEATYGGYGSNDREKRIMTLQDIIDKFEKPGTFSFYATQPLTPTAGASYIRRHFRFGNAFRVTLDQRMEYFVIDDDLRVKKLGGEDKSRVELKLGKVRSNKEKFDAISDILREMGATRLLSKRDIAYNLSAKHFKKTYNFQKKKSDTEIESKLMVPGISQQVLHKIKRDSYAGLLSGFRVLPAFEFTLQKGALLNYVIEPGRKGYTRFSGDENDGGVTTKDSSRLMSDKFGLGCILKRREIKTDFDSSLYKRPLQTMHKKRKFFFLESMDNKNNYCVMLDMSTYMKDKMFQLEVENLLFSPTRSEQSRAVNDIAKITKMILSRYPLLQPTTVSKLDWLNSISK